NQQKPNTGLRARLDAWRAPAARADPLRDRACVRKPRATVPAIKQILIYRLSAKETDGLKARRSTAAVGATARLRGRHTRCLNSAGKGHSGGRDRAAGVDRGRGKTDLQRAAGRPGPSDCRRG